MRTRPYFSVARVPRAGGAGVRVVIAGRAVVIALRAFRWSRRRVQLIG